MILKVKDENGQFKEVVLKGLKGDRGEDGTVLQQKEIDSIKTSLDNMTHVISLNESIMDYSELINKAIVNGVKNIKLGSGKFRIDNSIILCKNVQISGNGDDTVLYVEKDIPIFTTNSENNTENEDIKIKNIKLENLTTNSMNNNFHIQLCNTRRLLIDRVYIYSSNNNIDSNVGIYLFSDGTLEPPNGSFLGKIQNCTLANCKIKMGITDSYITNTEVWGVNRDYAIKLEKGSQHINSCQIVGGKKYGAVYVKNEDGNTVDMVRISNTFFDGSYSFIDSGIGLNAFNMISSSITNCSFWNQMDEGIKLTNCYSNTITGNNFENNNRRDDGKQDIFITSEPNTQGKNIITSNTFIRWMNNTNKTSAIKIVGSIKNIISNNTLYENSQYNSCNIEIDNSLDNYCENGVL